MISVISPIEENETAKGLAESEKNRHSGSEHCTSTTYVKELAVKAATSPSIRLEHLQANAICLE